MQLQFPHLLRRILIAHARHIIMGLGLGGDRLRVMVVVHIDECLKVANFYPLASAILESGVELDCFLIVLCQ